MSSVSSHNGYFNFWFCAYAVRVWLRKLAAFRKWASVTDVTVTIKQGAIMCIWSGSVGAEFDNMKGLNSVCQCVFVWYSSCTVAGNLTRKTEAFCDSHVCSRTSRHSSYRFISLRGPMHTTYAYGTLVDRLQGRVNTLRLN